MRRAAAAAALIEENDTVVGRIPKPSMHRIRPATRPSMYEQSRFPTGIAALLEVNGVQLIDAEIARIVRLDL